MRGHSALEIIAELEEQLKAFDLLLLATERFLRERYGAKDLKPIAELCREKRYVVKEPEL